MISINHFNSINPAGAPCFLNLFTVVEITSLHYLNNYIYFCVIIVITQFDWSLEQLEFNEHFSEELFCEWKFRIKKSSMAPINSPKYLNKSLVFEKLDRVNKINLYLRGTWIPPLHPIKGLSGCKELNNSWTKAKIFKYKLLLSDFFYATWTCLLH